MNTIRERMCNNYCGFGVKFGAGKDIACEHCPLNELPKWINDCDADAIANAYGRGYLKGREDILKEQQQMKDYCKNDCDALHEAYMRKCLESCRKPKVL